MVTLARVDLHAVVQGKFNRRWTYANLFCFPAFEFNVVINQLISEDVPFQQECAVLIKLTQGFFQRTGQIIDSVSVSGWQVVAVQILVIIPLFPGKCSITYSVSH